MLGAGATGRLLSKASFLWKRAPVPDGEAPADREPARPAATGMRRFLRLPGIENLSLLYIWAGLILLFGLLEPETFLRVNTARTILANLWRRTPSTCRSAQPWGPGSSSPHGSSSSSP